MPFQIRFAEIRDVAALSAVMRQTFWDTYHTFNTLENMTVYMEDAFSIVQQTKEITAPKIDNNTDLSVSAIATILVEIEDEIVGFAQIHEYYKPTPTEIPANLMFLGRFYLVNNVKGTGIAPHLLDACLAEATKRGFSGLWLTVWQRNDRAIRFYEKQNFQYCGTTTFTLGDDAQTDWLMFLTIKR